MVLSVGSSFSKQEYKLRQALKCFRLESIFKVVCQNSSVVGTLARFIERSMRSTTSILPTRIADWMKVEKKFSEKLVSRPSRSSARYIFSARVNSRCSKWRSICCSAARTCGCSVASREAELRSGWRCTSPGDLETSPPATMLLPLRKLEVPDDVSPFSRNDFEELMKRRGPH